MRSIKQAAEAFWRFTVGRRATHDGEQPLTLAELAGLKEYRMLQTLTTLMQVFGDLLPFIGTQVFTALDGLMRVVNEEGPTHALNRRNTHVVRQRNGRASVDYSPCAQPEWWYVAFAWSCLHDHAYTQAGRHIRTAV